MTSLMVFILFKRLSETQHSVKQLNLLHYMNFKIEIKVMKILSSMFYYLFLPNSSMRSHQKKFIMAWKPVEKESKKPRKNG